MNINYIFIFYPPREENVRNILILLIRREIAQKRTVVIGSYKDIALQADCSEVYSYPPALPAVTHSATFPALMSARITKSMRTN